MKKIILATLLFLVTVTVYAWYQFNVYNATEPDVVVEEKVSTTLKIKNLEFSFDDSSSGYIALAEEDGSAVTLFNKREYSEFSQREFPSEYPPSIIIKTFENKAGLSARDWAEINSLESNIELVSGEILPIEMAGAAGIRYKVDGLYLFDVYVLSFKDDIYLLSGAYFEGSDKIKGDFDSLIQNIVFE